MQFSCPEPPRAARPNSKSFSFPVTMPAPATTNSISPDPGPYPEPTPTPQTFPGVINVNIHFMLRLNGTGNFNETDDGVTYRRWDQPNIVTSADTANNGYVRAKILVTEMNNQAATNPMNGNPAGTSNPPKEFSYALNGVYFHRVGPSEFNIVKSRWQGIFTDSLFNNYGVNKASEINMFLTGDYQDSTSSAYDIGGVACTQGYQPSMPSSYWVKMFNSHLAYSWRQIHNGQTLQFSGGPTVVTQNSMPYAANTLGHEIGHIVGLAHTFHGANGCADAAVGGRGQGWNNQMDYVGGTALTPCQLGVVNLNLYNPGNPANSFRNYLSRSYYHEVPPRAFFVMNPCPSPSNVRMDSRGTFMADRVTIRVYAYDAAAASTRGALLTTYASNAGQGGVWNLANLYTFAAGQRYYVELTATRTDSNPRRSDGQHHSRGQVIQISPCAIVAPSGQQ